MFGPGKDTVDNKLNEISNAIATIQNPQYKSFAQSFHQTVSKQIIAASQSSIQIGVNSTKSLLNEYDAIFTTMKDDCTLLDPKEFYEKNKKRSESSTLKSTLLKGELSKATEDAMKALTAENLKKMKESREENIGIRHEYSVKCLTFVAYACYLNVISALVPGVDYRVPGSILLLAVTSVGGAQVTAPYNSIQEAWLHVRDISDRVMSNSGLRKCFHIGYKLTEKIAVTLNDRLEPYLGGEAAVQPNNIKKLTGL